MRPYALKAGEGWMYQYDINFTMKAGEIRHGRGGAVMEYVTRRGEEPSDHVHPTEDEAFYVLEGELTFRCGDETFEVETGGFIFLPQGIRHGYTIRSENPVRLLVITFRMMPESTNGWGGFAADIEQQGTLLAQPRANEA